MQTVLIAIHLMIVVALVVVVLLQRSEGGALGVGGGGGFMTGRGQANVLTRATAILAAAFFVTSLGLTLLARYGHGSKLDFNAARPGGPAEQAPKLPATQPDSILDQVRKLEQQRSGAAPAGTPAQPATAIGSQSTSVPPPTTQPAEPSGIPDRPVPGGR